MELEVFKISGESTQKKAVLSDQIFVIAPHEHAVYLDVKLILANKRQGTHKAKERNEIKGSTKKIKKQKGTGTARAGSIKSPLFRGGGCIFGPRVNNNHGFKINKKVKKLAKKSVLSDKIKKNNIQILEDIKLDTHKTKACMQIFKQLDCLNKKTLFVTCNTDKNFLLSSRNIQNVKLLHVNQINTYDLLNAEKIFFCTQSVNILNKNLV